MADRFPQPLKYQQLAPNATSVLGDIIDFPRILGVQETNELRLVTEIIKIVWDLSAVQEVAENTLLPDISNDTNFGYRCSLSYRALTAAEADAEVPTATLGSEAVLDVINIAGKASFTTSGLGAIMATDSAHIVHDLSCGGYGVLFPGHRLFLNQDTTTDCSTATMGCAIYYRQHLVGMSEFMGIFASRQQHD